MQDNIDDDLFLSDIEKLKAKYSTEYIEEDNSDVDFYKKPSKSTATAKKSRNSLKKEPTAVKTVRKPIDTSIFRDEVFDDTRDLYSHSDEDREDAYFFSEENSSTDTDKKSDKPDIEETSKNIDNTNSFDGVDLYDEPQDEDDAPENIFGETLKHDPKDFDDLDNDDDIKVITKKDTIKSERKPKKVKESTTKGKAKLTSKKSKTIRTITIAVAVPLVIWLTMFITDIVLVNKWYTPFFCIETAEYENGSQNFVGLFYKIQFHVEEDGNVSGECVPWFVDGPNDKI